MPGHDARSIQESSTADLSLGLANLYETDQRYEVPHRPPFSVVQLRRQTVRMTEPPCEFTHRSACPAKAIGHRRIGQQVGQRPQVVQHLEMVHRAPLKVPSVGENLFAGLAHRQFCRSSQPV